MQEYLSRAAREYDIALSPQQQELLCRFGAMLLEKNQVMNLTAITDPEAVALQHFIDCLQLFQAADFSGKRVIDIGCGAGFPGIPLLIAQPELRLTLLDSTAKRVRWLQDEVLPTLGLRADCVIARAEEHVSTCRESYDFAVCRAVAQLNILAELCLPYVKPGGSMLAMKGPGAQEEVQAAGRAITALGGKVTRILPYRLGEATHQIVVISKTAPTPARYPRRFSQIRQKPL